MVADDLHTKKSPEFFILLDIGFFKISPERVMRMMQSIQCSLELAFETAILLITEYVEHMT